ncbi:hypothetical protein Leryth_004001 [Lithospermum erythrorhizon]|nr:hypothetical protein Leryth_004001 [Lithospermum erythrorhizon]
MDPDTLLSDGCKFMIYVVNYLDIRSLLDLTCKAMVDTIKDKSLDEVWELLNEGFNPEEQRVTMRPIEHLRY